MRVIIRHNGVIQSLSRQTLTALTTTGGDDLAAADGRCTGAEAMPALADQLTRLIGAFHGSNSK
jgi:hypothetical protein